MNMAIEEQIEKAAESICTKIKTYHRIADSSAPAFSLDSLWAIDILLASDEARKEGGLLHFWEPITALSPAGIEQRRKRIFELGAYIGEVVRRHYGEKCKWVDDSNDEGLQYHQPISILQLPNGKNVSPSPIKVIETSLKNYTPGSIIAWARTAGLPVGDCPKLPPVSFS